MGKARWKASDVNTRPIDVDIKAYSCFTGQWIPAWINAGILVTLPCKVGKHIPVSVHAPTIRDDKYPLYMDVMRVLRTKGFMDIRSH